MKFNFPESVEKELAQQAKQEQQRTNGKITFSQHTLPVQQEDKTNVTQKMTPKELEHQQRKIENISSKLYTPQSPLTPEFRSKSSEIEERLQRIKTRFDSIKKKEEARIAQIQREAWLRYSHTSKPTLQDFKRPLTSFFLFASAIYITLQFSWYALEREKYIEEMENKQDKIVNQLNEALREQKQILDQYNSMGGARKWWKLW